MSVIETNEAADFHANEPFNNSLIRIATRESPLALWQANFVKSALKQHYPNLSVEIIGMTTRGDQLIDTPLAKLGGKGLFVKELEKAILDNRADIAVHSMKDVGTALPDGLTIHTIMARHNPFDAFVSNHYDSLATMPENSVVGSCSLRRVSQLKHHYPHLKFEPLRGNVNTRLKKLDNQEYDAIILACAGLERLDLHHRIKTQLSPEICLPAIAQGSIGIECRADDNKIKQLLDSLADTDTTICATAERAVNVRLQGSCQTPIAAFAMIEHSAQGATLDLKALIGTPDGQTLLTTKKHITLNASNALVQANDLGLEAAEALVEQGGLTILNELSRQ